MTTAAEKAAVPAKKEEKVEKRRALGRGLESLLPGPRVVVSTQYPVPSTQSVVSSPGSRVPSTESSTPQGLKPESSSAASGTLRPGSGPAAEAVPFPSSMEQTASDEMDATRAGAPALHEPSLSAFEEVLPGEVISIQAMADDRIVGNKVAHVPLQLIEKNPYQPRSVFDEKALEELRDSIKEHGVVQPVVVRPAEEVGRYILVLGERRLRASRMAGLETIPALVRRLSPQQAAEMTVLENVVREDLNPIEQAQAFRVLSQEFKLTQMQIAQRIGVSRESVANYMRLLRLPGKVMDYVAHGELSFSEARELLALENPEHILELAEEVIVTHPRLEHIGERVRRMNDFPAIPGSEVVTHGAARWVDPNVRAAQLEMERTLGMRVQIKDRNGKGKIVIEYASVDDYERVTSLLRGK
jgi:ParB family transcriptional regulator, chromosome partitioning protein